MEIFSLFLGNLVDRTKDQKNILFIYLPKILSQKIQGEIINVIAYKELQKHLLNKIRKAQY